MSYLLYRSARIGIGHRDDPFRSALTRHIIADGVSDFWDLIHDAHPVRYAFARCALATHAEIAADTDISALSPPMETLADVHTWLDSTQAFSAAQRAQIESDGVPLHWITAMTATRDVMRYLSRTHRLFNRARKNAPLMALYARGLNAHIQQAPAAQRDAALAMLAALGINASTLPASITVRHVIAQAIEAGVPESINFGPVIL